MRWDRKVRGQSAESETDSVGEAGEKHNRVSIILDRSFGSLVDLVSRVSGRLQPSQTLQNLPPDFQQQTRTVLSNVEKIQKGIITDPKELERINQGYDRWEKDLYGAAHRGKYIDKE